MGLFAGVFTPENHNWLQYGLKIGFPSSCRLVSIPHQQLTGLPQSQDMVDRPFLSAYKVEMRASGS